MGKTSADIEREIAEHRRMVERKIEALQERVRGDVDSLSSNVQDRASDAGSNVSERLDLDRHARERPMTLLGAAFGTGVLLGVVSEGLGGDDGRRDDRRDAAAYRRRPRDRSSGDGMLGELLGTTIGSMRGTFIDEFRTTLRDVFENERPADRRAESTDQRARDDEDHNGATKGEREESRFTG
jgi:hypothetical protein